MTANNLHILICECNSTEHQIVIHYEGKENLAYCHIHLSKRPFWNRVKLGLRYIFGYHCKYGHWDEFVLSSEHAKRIYILSRMLKYGGSVK